MKSKKYLLALIISALWSSLISCQPSANLSSVTSTPNPSVTSQRKLTICLGYEPTSLYIYKDSSQAAWDVREAIYDGPIDTLEGKPVPVLLDKIPSQSDGTIIYQVRSVNAGDMVFESSGELVVLNTGAQIFPQGCHQSSCSVTWDGKSPLQMDQLVIKYSLKPGIQWSDGQPLTAKDSIYSYQLANDAATPGNKNLIDQTDSYTALDDLNIQWIGKPGFSTENYYDFFWFPLPQHIWSQYSPQQLLTADESNRKPVGWGAYVIDEWKPGEYIRLVKNLNYFRASEGLPKFDILEFRFYSEHPEPNRFALDNGKCDYVDQTVNINEDLGEWIRYGDSYHLFKAFVTSSNDLQLLTLNLKNVQSGSVDTQIQPNPIDILGDIRVRQAVAYCLDRQSLVDKVTHKNSSLAPCLMDSNGSACKDISDPIVYDPAKGSELLEEAGWKETDKDPTTPRKAKDIPGIPDNTELALRLVTTKNDLQNEIATNVINSLKKCGIKSLLSTYNINDFFSPAPEGILFGRNFNLALFSWTIGQNFPCLLLASNENSYSSSQQVKLKIGLDISGYDNPDFDALCQQYNGINSYSDLKKILLAEKMQKAINQDIPIIPLFFYPTIALGRKDICGIKIDSSARSGLWNIESIDYGSEC